MKWPLVQLGTLCSFLNGGTPSKSVERYFRGEIPWITGADITSPVVIAARSFITEEAIQHSATNFVPAGTVLLVTRTSVGKVAIAGVPLCFSQDITAITPNTNKLDANYLVHFLKSQEPHFKQSQRGATIQGITRDVVAELKIPLPPLAEQQRIAAILDKADALREKRRQSLAKLDTLLQSVFLDMFGDPVTNPKGWPKGTIRDLVSEVNYGTSSKAGEHGQFPILRMNNITYQGGWNFDALKYIDLSAIEQNKYLAKKGDLLFNRTNSKELVGKTAVYRRDEPMAIAGYLIRVRGNNDCNTEYLSGVLNSSYGKLTLLNMCKSIIGMANINAQELQSIPILKPPKHLQDEYAAIVAKIEANKATLQTSLEKSNALFQSLQQRAFTGELFAAEARTAVQQELFGEPVQYEER